MILSARRATTAVLVSLSLGLLPVLSVAQNSPVTVRHATKSAGAGKTKKGKAVVTKTRQKSTTTVRAAATPTRVQPALASGQQSEAEKLFLERQQADWDLHKEAVISGEGAMIGNGAALASRSMAENLSYSSDHKVLTRLLLSKLGKEIMPGSRFTLLAPTDKAFEAITDPELKQALETDKPSSIIIDFLRSLFLEEPLILREADEKPHDIQSFNGRSYRLQRRGERAFLFTEDNQQVALAPWGVRSADGVIHVITTLLPPKPQE